MEQKGMKLFKVIAHGVFVVAALTAAVISGIKGNVAGAIWPIVAIVFYLISVKAAQLVIVQNDLIENLASAMIRMHQEQEKVKNGEVEVEVVEVEE